MRRGVQPTTVQVVSDIQCLTETSVKDGNEGERSNMFAFVGMQAIKEDEVKAQVT